MTENKKTFMSMPQAEKEALLKQLDTTLLEVLKQLPDTDKYILIVPTPIDGDQEQEHLLYWSNMKDLMKAGYLLSEALVMIEHSIAKLN